MSLPTLQRRAISSLFGKKVVGDQLKGKVLTKVGKEAEIH